MVKGTVALAFGGTMDEDVIHMEFDEDGGLAIFTDEDSIDAKFGIISLTIPTAGEVIDDNGALEIGTSTANLAEESSTKTPRSPGAVAGTHGEAVVTEYLPSAWMNDSNVLIFVFPGLEHMEVLDGVNNRRETFGIEEREDVIGARHLDRVGGTGIVDVPTFAVGDAAVLIRLPGLWDSEDGAVVQNLLSGGSNNAEAAEFIDEIAGNFVLCFGHLGVFDETWRRFRHEVHGGTVAELGPVLAGPFPPKDGEVLRPGSTIVGAVLCKV